jgi:hypothetical protein
MLAENAIDGARDRIRIVEHRNYYRNRSHRFGLLLASRTLAGCAKKRFAPDESFRTTR